MYFKITFIKSYILTNPYKLLYYNELLSRN